MPSSHTPAHYYVHTLPGLERVSWSEIHARLSAASLVDTRVVPERNALALFSYDGDPAPLMRLRTTEDVFCLVERLPRIAWGFEGITQIYEALAACRTLPSALAAHDAVQPRPKAPRPAPTRAPRTVSFRVIARLSGHNQPYRRVDLEKAVATGIERGTRKRWRAVQEGEEVEIWANLIGLDFICGLRLSGADMRNRPYKLVHLPASLRPSVAAAMVWLTEPRPDDVFMDPTCGAGTLLIERDAFGAHGPLLGGEIDPQALEAAVANIGPRFKPRQLFRWDARHLPLLPGSVNKIAANLPFGVQIGDPRENPALYRAVVSEMDRVLTADGRAVLLTSAAELLRSIVRDCPGLHIRHVHAVNLLGQQATIYVMARPK